MEIQDLLIQFFHLLGNIRRLWDEEVRLFSNPHNRLPNIDRLMVNMPLMLANLPLMLANNTLMLPSLSRPLANISRCSINIRPLLVSNSRLSI